MDYWLECTIEAIEAEAPEVFKLLTEKQLDNIAGWFEGAHENYGMAHGHDCIPNHLELENERLKNKVSFIKNHECEWVNYSGTAYMTGGGSWSYYCKHCNRTKTDNY
jgi:hypothetical protein